MIIDTNLSTQYSGLVSYTVPKDAVLNITFNFLGDPLHSVIGDVFINGVLYISGGPKDIIQIVGEPCASGTAISVRYGRIRISGFTVE